ncbi:hypothetical protein BCR39DRAFT_169167 [Naematelia encephala]|uniref:Fungal lipase-type domain-containing protein n=1 Tax=Naematelia encephala TaxID=71784 RepID=A0A1Y2B444_9TREE|nr:hypothetical protein BCR39DRAFT_169167 [Naematelia encephala]
MLFSTTLALLSTLSSISAMPTKRFITVLGTKDTTFQNLPVGRTAISRHDMSEIGRLASAVNLAYCSNEQQLELPGPAQMGLQPGRHRRRSAPNTESESHVVISSSDPEFEHLAQQVDMSWYISHSPSTQTLTLAFSSLSSVDDTLELLASSPSDLNITSDEFLLPLPYWLFPPEVQPQTEPPRIHHSLIKPFETHGTPALEALLDLLETPPLPLASHIPKNTPRDVLRSFTKHSATPLPIKTVEIIGHGLGAAVGLVAAIALHLEVTGPASQSYAVPLSPISIRTTLFGLPRVGDESFALWVDGLILSSPDTLQINRITSFADTIPHLPERHLDLAHPSLGEIWIGADPRMGYACRSAQLGQESDQCSGGLALQQTSLLDHAGPFGGVWIGKASCQ